MVEKLFRPTHPSSAKGFIVLSSYSKFSVDAANDLALLKADGKFSSLPIAASVRWILEAQWRRSVFPTSVCRGSRPSWLKTKSRRCPARRMTRAIFKSACRCSRAIRAGRWWMSGAGRAGSPLPAVRPNAKDGAHGVTRPTECVGGAGGKRGVAGECELRGQEQSAVELPGISARRFGQTQNAGDG